MKRRLCVTLFALGFTSLLLSAAPLDAFLDQPIPPGYVPHVPKEDSPLPPGLQVHYGPDYLAYDSYQERLDVLKKITPRRLVLPEGYADFIARVDHRSSWKAGGDILFSQERNGMGIGTTYRAFFQQSFQALCLNCQYDDASDTLVADFPWHHDDPRSMAELLHVLKTTHPAPELMRQAQPFDPWRTALDSLLSKPENFSAAWKMRFLDDARNIYAFNQPQSGTILWSGELPDEKNHPHFLVVNYHDNSVVMGTFCCYVFDAEGHFEYGAVLDGAYRASGLPHVDLQPSGKGLTIWYDPPRAACGYLYLERDGVMLHDSDERNGLFLGLPLYRTETILN